MAKNLLLFVALLLLFLTLATPVAATSSAQLKQDHPPMPEEKYRRAVVLYNFLDKYNSPLRNYAPNLVEEALRNNLDFRLLVAISGVESTFCQQIPFHSYNCWGWGIYGNNVIRFRSYPEAIGTISKALREHYIDRWGAENVYQIGRFYAASPTWAKRVSYFIQSIDEDLPLSL